MSDVIKTWPAFMERKKVLRIFTHNWERFYFSFGRGRPKREIERLWFTHCGEILGSFHVVEIVQNDGTLPKLRSLENRESEWQFKKDAWIAVCSGPIKRPFQRPVYHDSFRGWRYFDFKAYLKTPDAMIPA